MKFSFVILVALATFGALKVKAVPINDGKGLSQDLKDFLDLVPVDEIQELFFGYLAEDEDFGEVLDYVLSDEFKDLVIEIESIPVVKNLFKFLHDSGLDVYKIIKKIHEKLGIDEIEPLQIKFTKTTGGLKEFIEEVIALLPLDKMEKLYKEKLQTCKDFANLVKRLQSKEFQELVDKLMTNPQVKDIIKRAEAKGIDVQAFFDFLSTLLGLKFPSRPIIFSAKNLMEELQDFFELISTDKMLEVITDYQEDEGFQQTTRYFQTEEYKKLFKDAQNAPDAKNVFDFLEESGFKIYDVINAYNIMLGIGKVKPFLSSGLYKRTGGFEGYMKDLMNVLPKRELRSLHLEKIKKSQTFARFVKRVYSVEFEKLTGKLLLNKEVQHFIEESKAHDFDLEIFLNYCSIVFGFKA